MMKRGKTTRKTTGNLRLNVAVSGCSTVKDSFGSREVYSQASKKLRAGDQVLLSGTIYTARDAAHKKMGDRPPFSLKNAVIFYASPTPTPPGRVIGSIGPTTSSRMDAFTPALLKKGLAGMIGKGERSPEVVLAMKRSGAVYFVVPGGIAALLSQYVKKAKLFAYPELGSEAIYQLEVSDLPLIVAIDSQGKSLFHR